MCCEKLKELLDWLTTKETWLRPRKPSISRCFWIVLVIGFVSLLVLFALNIKTLYQYSTTAEWWYFSILLMTIILPQVPINLFSFWWFRTDNNNQDRLVSWLLTIAHCLLLALPLRMCRMGYLAKRVTSGNDITTVFEAQADLSFLRLVGVYAGSGSQLVVRIYMLLKNWSSLESIVSDVIFGSLAAASLALSTISLSRHCRRQRLDKQELSYVSMFLQALYRICFLASRVVALACLFNLGEVPALGTCSCLFVVFLIWFRCMKTEFTENVQQELFYHALMAFLHIFGMLNVKDSSAKFRYAFYYSLSFFFDASVFITFMSLAGGMYWLSLLPCVFLIGLACHGVEHVYFHPRGRLYIEREPDEECAADEESANNAASAVPSAEELANNTVASVEELSLANNSAASALSRGVGEQYCG